MVGDKSNRIIASFRLYKPLIPPCFSRDILVCLLVPTNFQSSKHSCSVPNGSYNEGVYDIHSWDCQILHCKCLIELNDLQGRRNSQKLTLTWGDGTLESWEKRQEPWEAIEEWREMASPLLLSSGSGGLPHPKPSFNSTQLSPSALSKSLLLTHLPSCSCIQALNNSWKKFDAQPIDINGKVHQLLR